MDSELVKAAATTIVTVERIVPEASFRAAPAPHHVSALHGRAPWSRRRGARTRRRCFPTLRLRRRLLPRLRRGARRPGAGPGLLGAADRRRPRRTPPFSTRTAAPARCCRSRGERRDARVHDRRADGDDAGAGVHERHTRVQRRRLVRPRLRLPAGAAHACPGARLGGELDRHRRRPQVDPGVDAVGRPLGRRLDALELGVRLLVVRAEPPLQHLRVPRRPDGRLRERQQHDDRAVRLAEGAPARRRRHGRSELHDPAHLPLVDDARPAHVRRAARLPLGDRLGRRRRPPGAPRAARAARSSASPTCACSTSTRTRSGCRSAASIPASPPSR